MTTDTGGSICPDCRRSPRHICDAHFLGSSLTGPTEEERRIADLEQQIRTLWEVNGKLGRRSEELEAEEERLSRHSDALVVDATRACAELRHAFKVKQDWNLVARAIGILEAFTTSGPNGFVREVDRLQREAAELRTALEAEKKAREWASEIDQPIPEDTAIKAAFPTRSGRHDMFAEAMRMVGAKRSKYALVGLVSWLLIERDRLVRARSKPEGA